MIGIRSGESHALNSDFGVLESHSRQWWRIGMERVMEECNRLHFIWAAILAAVCLVLVLWPGEAYSQDEPGKYAEVVHQILKEEHDKRTLEEISTAVSVVLKNSGERPELVLAVMLVESRLTLGALGDNGRACGPGQQHARYSVKFGLSRSKKVREECDLLKSDWGYAAVVVMHNLDLIEKRYGTLTGRVCHYNSGAYRECTRRSRSYDRRVMRIAEKIRRAVMEST